MLRARIGDEVAANGKGKARAATCTTRLGADTSNKTASLQLTYDVIIHVGFSFLPFVRALTLVDLGSCLHGKGPRAFRKTSPRCLLGTHARIKLKCRNTINYDMNNLFTVSREREQLCRWREQLCCRGRAAGRAGKGVAEAKTEE